MRPGKQSGGDKQEIKRRGRTARIVSLQLALVLGAKDFYLKTVRLPLLLRAVQYNDIICFTMERDPCGAKGLLQRERIVAKSSHLRCYLQPRAPAPPRERLVQQRIAEEARAIAGAEVHC